MHTRLREVRQTLVLRCTAMALPALVGILATACASEGSTGSATGADSGAATDGAAQDSHSEDGAAHEASAESGADASADALADAESDVGDGAQDVVQEGPGADVSDGGGVITYPPKRVGVFYLAWHAYAADAMAQLAPADRFSIEDVIRSPSLHFSDVLSKHGKLGEASWFHYHATPKLGYYCLYRKRPGDPDPAEPAFAPDCPNIPLTAKTHADQLWNAGVDFVYLDLTNFGTFDTASDVMALRPLEVLLEEWTALRAAGHPTPQIGAWLPVPAVQAGQVPLIDKVLEVYANPAFNEVLLTHQPTGQKVLFVVDHGGFPPDAGNMAKIAAQGIVAARMWGNLDAGALAAGTAGWMQPCTEGSAFTTLVTPDRPCQQGYSASTALGSVLSVSASYQVGYASLPFQSSGRLGGLTLKKQFETAFAVQPDYLLINAWNEHIAQPQPNPHDASLGGLRRSMGETDAPAGDPGADWLWVDMYGRELSRDLEPTEEDDGAAYELLQSCLRVYRTGHPSCDQPSEACCQLGQGMSLVRSLRHTSDTGQMTSDHLLTLSATERDSLVASGAWAEVCNPFYGPPGLCGGGTTGDAPFSVFAEPGADRTLVYRCYSGVDHFVSPSSTCEGTQVEGPLGWVSNVKTSATPRPLRRCYNTAAQAHFHWLDEHCPALPSVTEESVIGYVR